MIAGSPEEVSWIQDPWGKFHGCRIPGASFLDSGSLGQVFWIISGTLGQI